MQNIDHPGTLFTVSAPSGAGKTSLVNAWLKRSPNLDVSVSYTTRPQREGEENGVNYHFVNHAEFEEMIAQQAFFEYAKVFNNYYGTAKSDIADKLKQGKDIILEIDWQGAHQVKALYPKTVAVFVLPPSYEVLQQRLFGRAREHSAEIKLRLEQAKIEMRHCIDADYIVINDDFEQALGTLVNLQQVMHLKTAHQRFAQRELLAQLLD